MKERRQGVILNDIGKQQQQQQQQQHESQLTTTQHHSPAPLPLTPSPPTRQLLRAHRLQLRRRQQRQRVAGGVHPLPGRSEHGPRREDIGGESWPCGHGALGDDAEEARDAAGVGRTGVGVAGGVVVVVVVVEVTAMVVVVGVVVVVVVVVAPPTVFKLLRGNAPTLFAQGLLQRFPGGRAATSREVADVIVFLCSDRAG
jgi:hypothetical protein